MLYKCSLTHKCLAMALLFSFWHVYCVPKYLTTMYLKLKLSSVRNVNQHPLLHTVLSLSIFKSLTETTRPSKGRLCFYSLICWVRRIWGCVVASEPEAGNLCQSLHSAWIPRWLRVDLGEGSPSRSFGLTCSSLISLRFPCFTQNFTLALVPSYHSTP